jgi:hypothetical protein
MGWRQRGDQLRRLEYHDFSQMAAVRVIKRRYYRKSRKNQAAARAGFARLGSVILIQTFIQDDLVDAFWLMIYTILLGGTYSQSSSRVKIGRRFVFMRHTREEVITRIVREFERLDRLVNNLTEGDWNSLLTRPETKDAWTVKDALAHITHWKADEVRKIKKQPIPAEEKGLNWTDGNHLIYERWRERTPREVLTWHRQVQEDILVALQDAPEAWFTDRERRPEWPFDLDGHSSYHRVKDIEHALKESTK